MAFTTQLIDSDGVFNISGLESFIESVRLDQYGVSYNIVSIIGPQSSGKSTLLNHLFRTTFREMDARQGRNQTTKGIWIAKAVDIDHPCTIVMDLEGNDGSERGEDGKAFERWSALFSLAISDIVMVNIWCHDIGRDDAANKPLLRIVFQVMMQLFDNHKTTLLFIIRDKTTMTPFFLIERKLKEEVQKIWNMVPKPRARKEATLDEFFNLRVTALPNYEFQKDQFKEELIELRRKCSVPIARGGYAKDKQDAVPASALSINMQNIWKDIRKNKDLDIPAYKVLVATARCQEIADELLKVYPFGEIKHYRIARQADIQSFARWVRQVLDSFVQDYDEKTINFDEGVRTTKREYLKARFLNLLNPAYDGMLGCLYSEVLSQFQQDLRQALKKKKGFSISVQSCATSCLRQFDELCADAKELFSNQEARESLRESFLTEVVSQHAKLIIKEADKAEDKEVLCVLGSIMSTVGAVTSVADAGAIAVGGAALTFYGSCIHTDDDLPLPEEKIREMVNQVFQVATSSGNA